MPDKYRIAFVGARGTEPVTLCQVDVESANGPESAVLSACMMAIKSGLDMNGVRAVGVEWVLPVDNETRRMIEDMVQMYTSVAPSGTVH